MAFTGLAGSLKPVVGSEDYTHRGYCQFDGSALTLELPVPMELIRPGSTLNLTYGDADPANAEQVYLKEAVNADGVVEVPASGEITIARKVEAGGTITNNGGLFFCFHGA